MPQNELIALEEQDWEALSSGGQPGGLVLDDRATIVDSMSGQPWSSYELQDVQAFQPTQDAAVVTYGVVARRDAQQYSALMSSVYVRREDGWKSTFHQQTPR